MNAALRLVPDVGAGAGDDDGGLTPIEQWELYIRGAGRSDRTVRDGIAIVQRLERQAGKACTEIRGVDVSRFLADPDLRPSSRASYFGSIHRFLLREGVRNDDPTILLDTPRLPKPLPKFLSEAEVDALLAAAARKPGRPGALARAALYAAVRFREKASHGEKDGSLAWFAEYWAARGMVL